MPVLSDKKLEMADIGDINALMLSHQVTTQQRTHIIRQKTVSLSGCSCTGHKSPAIFVTQQSTSGFGMFLY